MPWHNVGDKSKPQGYKNTWQLCKSNDLTKNVKDQMAEKSGDCSKGVDKSAYLRATDGRYSVATMWRPNYNANRRMTTN